MKDKVSKKKLSIIFKSIFFITLVVIIVQLLPRENRFKYYYQISKPWEYETLIAPYDFPVYKEEALYKKEKDSAVTNILPYYRWKEEIFTNQIEKFEENFPLSENFNAVEYKNYIKAQLSNLYYIGIVS